MDKFDFMKQIFKKGGKMSEQNVSVKTSGKNYNEVMKAYGQIYAGFLLSEKADKFTIKNIHVREWKRIFGWMKKNQYIVDFEYGHDYETACELTITGFNEENMIYKKYCEGVKRNILQAV